MNRKLLFPLFITVTLGTAPFLSGIWGCIGGSTRATTGEADSSSLTTVPSTDISQLDPSLNTSSTSSLSTLKTIESGSIQGQSRHGCELNAHKQEAFRFGLEAEISKCYIKAMEKCGVITIPDVPTLEQFAYYKVKPGSEEEFDEIEQGGGGVDDEDFDEEDFEDFDDEGPSGGSNSGTGSGPTSGPSGPNSGPSKKQQSAEDEGHDPCEGIPDELEDEKEACESGDHGAPECIVFRTGRIDGKLMADLCFSAGQECDELKLEEEMNYEASGSVSTAHVIHEFTFGDEEEKAQVDATIDLGTDGSINDGEIDLGTDGTASITARMTGKWGDGTMTAQATPSRFVLSGAFEGNFVDPFQDVVTSFSGKAKGILKETEGCAKFRFVGSPPSWPVTDMIVGIPEKDIPNFLKNLNLECSDCNLTAENYKTKRVCPNPNHDPASKNDPDPPMIGAKADNTCKEITHEDVGCFVPSNATEEGTFVTKITQTFLKVDCGLTTVGEECKAFDLSDLKVDVSGVGFERNWDCTGDFSDVDFTETTEDEMEECFAECFALDEKLFSNEGMGGRNCDFEEKVEVVDNFVDDGGQNFGKCGGEYKKTTGGNCATSASTPATLWVDAIDPNNNKYCVQTGERCSEYTLSGTSATNLSIEFVGGNKLTSIAYNSEFSTADLTFTSSAGTCTDKYTVSKPTFEKVDTFNPNSKQGPPEACIQKFGADVTEEECHALCRQKDDPCHFGSS